jgi:hypothetical protein
LKFEVLKGYYLKNTVKKTFLKTSKLRIISKWPQRPLFYSYGVETWFDCAPTHKKKLQIIQNKCLKIIQNRHWRYSTAALHEETNMPRIENFGDRIRDKFLQRSRLSENSLILGLLDF